MSFNGVISHRADDRSRLIGRLRQGLSRYSAGAATAMCPSAHAWMGDATGGCGSVDETRRRHAAYVTFDGRLDNAADLKWCLHLADDTSDSALVAACYRQWKRNAFTRFIGDWAVAIYDFSSDEVLLARDYPGARSVYYYLDDHRLVWSTELLDIITALGAVRVEPPRVCRRAVSVSAFSVQ